MFDKLSAKNIWVATTAPDASTGSATGIGNGTFHNPYLKIQTAVEAAVSGSVIVLFSGNYDEKLVVRDISGTIDEPITITAYNQNGEDVVSHADWYFYSACDFVIKGIKFKKTANSAISMIGESQRNSIKDCEFIECGEVSDCTIFFGGSGGECNSIENCSFTAPKDTKNHIAVMISQSASTGSATEEASEEYAILNSRNTTLRFCRFKDCRTAVVAGSDENISGLFGEHEIADNLFENCETGVKIKISGTQIYRNIFRDCKNGVENLLGAENEIFENRFENCEKAVAVFCDDLTIKENCFINSSILLDSKPDEAALPILICENTFVSAKIEANETIGFATRNIFYETKISGNAKKFVETDNEISETTNFFSDFANGDFSSNSNYGCVSGAEKRLEIAEIPLINIAEMFEKQEKTKKNLPQRGLSPETMEERDLFLKSMYFQDETEEDEIELEAMSVGQQGLRAIGIDGELEDN